MSISVSTDANTDAMTICVNGSFDFSVHGALRNAYENAATRHKKYVVDLTRASYMDSSALGMLLQLREFAGNASDAVVVKNARGAVRDVLKVANFDRLMRIE